eukprot:4648558-Prorocentrum_lima.AAC.1
MDGASSPQSSFPNAIFRRGVGTCFFVGNLFLCCVLCHLPDLLYGGEGVLGVVWSPSNGALGL